MSFFLYRTSCWNIKNEDPGKLSWTYIWLRVWKEAKIIRFEKDVRIGMKSKEVKITKPGEMWRSCAGELVKIWKKKTPSTTHLLCGIQNIVYRMKWVVARRYIVAVKQLKQHTVLRSVLTCFCIQLYILSTPDIVLRCVYFITSSACWELWKVRNQHKLKQ